MTHLMDHQHDDEAWCDQRRIHRHHNFTLTEERFGPVLAGSVQRCPGLTFEELADPGNLPPEQDPAHYRADRIIGTQPGPTAHDYQEPSDD